MRFEINLASQPYGDVQRFLARWRMGLLALALVTAVLVYAAGSAFLSWRSAEKQLQQLRNQVAERAREKAAIEAVFSRPENNRARNQAQFLNTLLARKAFSWTEVFSDLERLVPPTLNVRALHPEVNEDGQLEVRLSVAGTNREGAVELERRLEQSPHFMQPRILSESTSQAIGQPGPNGAISRDTVQFELSAIYLPAFARAEAQSARQPGTPAGSEVPSVGR
jgi:type IV pilus assembly protein PilN